MRISMRRARWLAVVVGVLLPGLAWMPYGLPWQPGQETGVSLSELAVGTLIILGFNAVPWGAALLFSQAYRHPASLLAPALPGAAFLAWAYATLDLAADPQQGIALMFIPLYALMVIIPGGFAGLVLDMFLRRRQHGPAPGGGR